MTFESKILSRIYDEREHFGRVYSANGYIALMRWLGSDHDARRHIAMFDMCEWDNIGILVSTHEVLLKEYASYKKNPTRGLLKDCNESDYLLEMKCSELAIALRMNRFCEKYQKVIPMYQAYLENLK